MFSGTTSMKVNAMIKQSLGPKGPELLVVGSSRGEMSLEYFEFGTDNPTGLVRDGRGETASSGRYSKHSKQEYLQGFATTDQGTLVNQIWQIRAVHVIAIDLRNMKHG